MSFKYAHAGVYRCDMCGAKQLSLDGELPEGWHVGIRWRDRDRTHVPPTDPSLLHRCPDCPKHAEEKR